MRKRTLLNRCVALAILGSTLAFGQSAHAADDFKSLLADVQFGQPAPIVEPTASDSLQFTAADTPMPLPVPEPVAEGEVMDAPAIPQPLQDQGVPYTTVDPAVGAVGDCGCGNSCEGHCGHGCHGGHCGHLLTETACTPYVTPQLPTSTFYQYWRSNACNTHVWDGYRNRCHAQLNLGGHCGNGHCGSGHCGSGQCGSGQCGGNCGPAPVEWVGGGSCDSCDAQ
ncbi:hypothetical protein FYK55_09710 [Roseiconus nitratireducens]|uniref:Uncharacterized protein n=1 Tax=Roseiconus nitratireducens TaxID=2605748 RepID=A0A5M6DE71_9BACT|nr:hypothetical protein [Roseiconus nitratireducens]KAA5544582.1 hypothetical protein FYK55_09710 [Roseiconus nitratireducens]